MYLCLLCFLLFFFNDTATTEIYTLSLHDALPISLSFFGKKPFGQHALIPPFLGNDFPRQNRSEEHTSELQSHSDLVCRLLLEKKKNRPFMKPSIESGRTTPPTLTRQTPMSSISVS